MKKLTNTNHNPPSGYELFMDATDSLGRHWKFMVSPVRHGSVAYFNRLSDYVRWIRNVEQIRKLSNGELSFSEKLMNEVRSGYMSRELATRLILKQ